MRLQLNWTLSGFCTQVLSGEHSGVTEFNVAIANDPATEAWFKQHVEQLVTSDLLALLLMSLASPAEDLQELVKVHAARLGVEPPASALVHEAAVLDFLAIPPPDPGNAPTG